MNESSPRFSTPTSVSRPRGSRLITAFSPTLQRSVCAFDYVSFAQWVRLEADPSVASFCERPARVGAGSDAGLIDFWVQRASLEELLVIDRGRIPTELPATLDGVALKTVPAAELTAAATWIANWFRMIPVINATRGLTSKGLARSALKLIRSPLALSRVEHELSIDDPSLVRGTVFELLRTGQLSAPSLHTHPLSPHTTLEPAP